MRMGNWQEPDLFAARFFSYNFGMDELLQRLEKIGFTRETCERIRERYDGDEKGLRDYVLFCVALFDDRHEYMD